MEGFPGGKVNHPPASAGDAGDAGLTPGSERSPGEGISAIHSNILPRRNPMGRGAWQATVTWSHKESDTTEHTHTHLGWETPKSFPSSKWKLL